MSELDEILTQYEKRNEPVSHKQQNQISIEASIHLSNYLVGDGNVQHLYDYYECLEKIN